MNKRMFATVQARCAFGCIYCFTNCDNYKQSDLIDDLSQDDILRLAKDTSIIQPACDTELLMHPNWKEILLRLTALKKDISFATKMSISESDIEFLSRINKMQNLDGNILNIGVTIIKLDEYDDLEPFAPTPLSRIETLKMLHENGIACNVIIRPIFPTLSIDEISRLIKLTHSISYGYLLGPLYLNKQVVNYLSEKEVLYTTQKKYPTWNQEQSLDVLYCHEIMTSISETCADYNKHVFFSNEHCINSIKNCIMVREVV